MKTYLGLLFFASAALAASPPDGTPVVKFQYPPESRDYLWTMIACDEKEERFASDVFDAFLSLTARRELKKEELRFPASFAVRLPNYVVLSRGFYVSPNELRGFDISVPKNCLVEKDGLFSLTTPVVIDKEDRRQGITVLVLKKKQNSFRFEVRQK